MLVPVVVLTDVVGEEHDEEWCHQVIDPLHVATGRMTH